MIAATSTNITQTIENTLTTLMGVPISHFITSRTPWACFNDRTAQFSRFQYAREFSVRLDSDSDELPSVECISVSDCKTQSTTQHIDVPTHYANMHTISAVITNVPACERQLVCVPCATTLIAWFCEVTLKRVTPNHPIAVFHSRYPT